MIIRFILANTVKSRRQSRPCPAKSVYGINCFMEVLKDTDDGRCTQQGAISFERPPLIEVQAEAPSP